jgi:hypothetical protein
MAKRPRGPNQLAMLIVDMSTGEAGLVAAKRRVGIRPKPVVQAGARSGEAMR